MWHRDSTLVLDPSVTVQGTDIFQMRDLNIVMASPESTPLSCLFLTGRRTFLELCSAGLRMVCRLLGLGGRGLRGQGKVVSSGSRSQAALGALWVSHRPHLMPLWCDRAQSPERRNCPHGKGCLSI